VVIVGSGPAGIAASLAAIEAGLSFVTLEQEQFGGTVAHYPRGKLVMTRPVELPLIGRMPFTEVGKEDLLAFWTKTAQDVGLQIAYGTRVDSVERAPYGFQVITTNGTHHARHVLLAIGRRGTPRQLGVPGEELPKVVYRLIEPEQYAGQNVLVVGGGDSALEAAASLVDAGAGSVMLSYRGQAFARAKATNRARIEALLREGRLGVALDSEVEAIDPAAVLLRARGESRWFTNDVVIVCAGGILPTAFLQSMGIEVETKYGTA
jgi:thioredoxin reductase